jgi:hypothetical protein
MIKDMRQSTTSDTSVSPETSSKSQDDLKRPSSTLAEKAKKKNWYNVIYPSYKSRSDDFKKLFSIPEDERLLVGKFFYRTCELKLLKKTYVNQLRVCDTNLFVQVFVAVYIHARIKCDNIFIIFFYQPKNKSIIL